MQISDRFLLVTDSGADYSTVLFQAIKWCACDWNDDLWLVDDNHWRLRVLWSSCKCYCYLLFVLCNTFNHVYFGSQKFSLQMHTERKTGAEKRRRKMSWFTEPISGACVMGLTVSGNVVSVASAVRCRRYCILIVGLLYSTRSRITSLHVRQR